MASGTLRMRVDVNDVAHFLWAIEWLALTGQVWVRRDRLQHAIRPVWRRR